MTSGLLKEADLSPVITLEPAIKNKYPKMLKHGDQGALNYVFTKACQNGKIRMRYVDFWIWPGVQEAKQISLESIKNKLGLPIVMHWAGIKTIDVRKYDRYDILRFYENYYFSQVPFGNLKKFWNDAIRIFILCLKIAKHRLFREHYI